MWRRIKHIGDLSANLIRLYRYDGELLGWWSLAKIKRMEAAGMVRVVRTRKGKPVRAIRYRRPFDPPPITLGQLAGTRYSWQQRLDNGLKVWTLKESRRICPPPPLPSGK